MRNLLYPMIISVIGATGYLVLFMKYFKKKDGFARLFILWLFSSLFLFFLFRLIYLNLDFLGIISMRQRSELANFNVLLLFVLMIYHIIYKLRSK